MTAREVIILGCNGTSVDIAEAIEAQAAHGEGAMVIGFLDDADRLQGQTIGGYPVLGRIEDAGKFSEAWFVNGIGNSSSYQFRLGIITRTGVSVERWFTVIHPTSVVSRHAQIGLGAVLLANVSVGAYARIGRHCTILQNAIVAHDSRIGDYTSVAGGVSISGGCTVGESCYLGSNVSIREGIRIAPGSLIGIGSVVVKNVDITCTVFGNPALPRK